MKKLYTMLFGYLILSLAIGSVTPVAATLGAHRLGSHAALTLAASPDPQTTGAPVGLPNGTQHSTALSWTPGPVVTGVTIAGYNVFRSTTAGGEAGTTAINGSTPITGTTYTDLSVVPGTTYFYVATAQSSTGNQSGFSNEATTVIPGNPSNPTGCNGKGQ